MPADGRRRREPRVRIDDADGLAAAGARLDLSVVLPVVLAFAGIAALLVRLGVRAQRQAPLTGAAGMIGAPAEVVTAIEPGRTGHVKLHGELWRAEAAEPIAAGARVVVTHVDGLTLTVRQT